MATEWQRFEVELDPRYTEEERSLIAQEIIDQIKKRTEEGRDKNGRKFAGYSKEYTKSLNFKIAGKSPGDVNLTQSGDMLGALDVLESDEGKLVIGWEKDSLENAIADGNIRGTYGHEKRVGPARNPLGIMKKELAEILANHPVEDQSSREEDQRVAVGAQELLGTLTEGMDRSAVIPTLHGDGGGE